MKKHNDGYVLIFVLVVFLVLSIAAVALMTISLNNLKAQQASIDRVQAKYRAEGMIEEFLGRTCDLVGAINCSGKDFSDEEAAADAADAALLAAVNEAFTSAKNAIAGEDDANPVRELDCEINAGRFNDVVLQLTATYSGEESITATVSADVRLAITADVNVSATEDTTTFEYNAAVSSVAYTITAYTVTYASGGDGT